MSSLGERIRARRKELGLTQSQLGGPDLTKGFISLVEKGRAKPSIETLVLLARRLQKPVGYFLEEGTPLSRKDLDVLVRSAWVALKRGEFADAADAFTRALAMAQQQHDEPSRPSARSASARRWQVSASSISPARISRTARRWPTPSGIRT